VYNLETNGTHTYTTDAFSIHNCGDVMKMYIKIDEKNQTIKECKWKTFGCASAIASTSMLSTMIIGMKLEEAKKITPQDIVKALGGLPARKIHCSVLGDQALRAAIEDYHKKQGESKKSESS
jgi:nitrogen fixation NifU-like protein/NifU-like protein